MASLASSVRRLIDLTVTNVAPPAILEQVVGHLGIATDLLAGHVPPKPLVRIFGEAPVEDTEVEAGVERSIHSALPYDPVIGRCNPVAVPLTISFEPPVAVGTVRFTTPYEGAPGWVHGAAVASAFDMLLTAANQIAGAAGPTVWLKVRFRRPTLLGVETRMEAEVVSKTVRRVTSRGHLLQNGEVCAEAEGEFALVDPNSLLRSDLGSQAIRSGSPGMPASGKEPSYWASPKL